MGMNNEVIVLSNKVLSIDSNNLKAFYRRALAIVNVVDEKEKLSNNPIAFLEEANDLLSKASRDLEKIVQLDKSNTQAADKFKEVQLRNVQYRLKL